MGDEPLDRRGFFRHGLRNLARSVADSLSEQAGDGAAPATEARPHQRLRPPGALAEAEFLERCTRCDACFDACPVDAIVPVPDGRPDAGTPQLKPAETACVLCHDLACTKVCEPGALEPLLRPAEVAIGLARVDPQHCVTYHGQACDACVTTCPTTPLAVNLVDGHPAVEASRCTGCGLCEQLCPVWPKAIVVEDPAREAWRAAAEVESPAAPGDNRVVAADTPPPDDARKTTRRVEPIREADEAVELASIPRPLAAVLLIVGPIFAVIGVMGWLLLLLSAPVDPAPEFHLGGLALNLFLCLLFIAPHSLFARGLGRRWLNIPFGPCGERPLYVFVTGVTLTLLAFRWQVSGPVLWSADGVFALVLRGVQFAGLVLAFWAAFVVGGAQMLGLPHLRALSRGGKEPSVELVALPPYSLIRQPLNLGVLLALAAMPDVTLDRLLLAAVFGIWILFVAPYEERDAEMQLGEGYVVYRNRTPRWFPRRRPPEE